MRTIILLTILAVSPISCRFYLNRELAGNDEAFQISQKLIDTVRIAYTNLDLELFLSCFDKSFTADGCGEHVTLADLEENLKSIPKDIPGASSLPRFEVVKAIIDGDYLKFEVIKNGGSPSVTDKWTAIRSGSQFKLIKAIGEICK